MAIAKKTFTQDDLDGSNRLVWVHNLNNQDLVPVLYDNNGVQAITSDMFKLGNETGSNKDTTVTLDISGFAPISDTWKLLLNYSSPGESGSGRRAFELGENNDPALDFRVILGKEDTPSINIKLSNFLTWLLSKLGFLKVESNLSDLNNAAISRENLGVYSKTAVDNGLAEKASLYQAASGSALGTANTAVYTPTSTYHPAVLKTVIDYIAAYSVGGTYSYFSDTTKTLTGPAKLVYNNTSADTVVTLSNTITEGSIIVIKRGSAKGVVISSGAGTTIFPPNHTAPYSGNWGLPNAGDSVIIVKQGTVFNWIAYVS